MTPTLQHVRPSGRGMESEHEQAAKRSAVEFIERRIDHNEQVRRTAARKRAIRSAFSILGGTLVLAGIAYYFTHRTGETSGLEELKEVAASASETILRSNPYTDISREFAADELVRWKDAPSSVRPKNAPAGAVYHALVPKTGYYALFELKARGDGTFDVSEIAQDGTTTPSSLNAYNQACAGGPYFIAYQGLVYAGGNESLKTMNTMRKNMLPSKGAN